MFLAVGMIVDLINNDVKKVINMNIKNQLGNTNK
jgi:hypothetical protein